MTSIQVLDLAGIGEDGFLFEMSDETMAGFGGDEVGDEEGVEEYALSAQNHYFHEPEFLKLACPFSLDWQSRHVDDYEHDSTKKKERKK